MEPEKKVQQKQSVIRSAALMSAGTLSSRILGLLRDVVLAAFFSRTVTDSFVVAFSFPNKFRRLLGEGSLSVSFIPIYLEKAQRSPEEARQLSNGVFTLLLAVTSALCVFGVVFMNEVMSLLVSGKGFREIPGKFENTVLLGQIMFSYLFLVTSYAYLMALLNAFKQFFIPAVAPALFNLIFIICAMLPSSWSSFPGQRLAWGVLLGGVVQVLLVAIPLYRQGHLPKLQWRWPVPGMSKVLRNMVPGILGMGILQFLTLVNINYASRLGEGTHSYIYWADRILELPQSLVAISLGAALLPTLSELWSQGKKLGLLNVGQRHMRALLFLCLPSAVGMYLLAQPIVEVLYMRGNFTLSDAENTAMVVRFYSGLLVAVSLTRVVIPNFYAIQNTWLPAVTAVFSLLVHIGLGYFWVDWYGLRGLVASTTLSGFINLFLVLFFYHRMIGPLDSLGLMRSVVKLIPALVVMGGFVYLFYPFLLEQLTGVSLSVARTSSLLITIIGAVLLYFGVSYQLGVHESRDIIGRVIQRWRR